MPVHEGELCALATRPPEQPLSDAVLARLREALKDSYLVERELGEGGAATVYLARDIKHERNVAIKVFKPELAETLGAERFSREIRTAANLQHPHILTVHDSGVAGGLLYYVMPYVEGESLRARITREGGLPIADVIRIMREVADALGTAHAAGVVHRDIKPDNVLLSGRHALVADFGVAKAISESTGRNAITTLGVALGTPAYMAPEQAAADPHVDHRADIYALGILGYEMLTGEPPFVRRSPHEVLAAHVTEPAPAVSVRRQSVPPALEALIAKCLLKQPGDRFQSAGEVEAELERVMTPSGGMSPVAGMSPTSATAAVRAAAARSRFMRAAAFTAATAAAVAASWYGGVKMRGGAKTDTNLVAVVPFEFNATPDLAYLREGVVNMLEMNLTGQGGPRAVASSTVIAQWKRRGGDSKGLTDDEAHSLASELGASYLLRGSIVGAGNELVVSGSLSSVDRNAPPVQAQVRGPADSIQLLVTRLAGQLMSIRLGASADRAVALQSVPWEAQRAYLQGQQFYRQARYNEAMEAFGSALAIDSTFALAGMGQSMASGFSLNLFGTSNGNAIAFRHRDKLSPPDRTYLEIVLPSSFAGRALSDREAMDVRERLVQRIPDRAEAWYVIGDTYFHYGQGWGMSRIEATRRAQAAFERALQLDPGLISVRHHLADQAANNDQWDRFAVLVDSLGITSPHHRLAAAIVKGESSTARALADSMRSSSTEAVLWMAAEAGWAGATPLAEQAFADALNRPGTLAERRGALRLARQQFELYGQAGKVRSVQRRLAELDGAGPPLAPGEDIYLAMFAGGDTTLAERAGAALDSPNGFLDIAPDTARRMAAWYVGAWAAAKGDTARAKRAIAYLDAMGAQRDSTGRAALARPLADGLRLLSATSTPPLDVVERADGPLRDGPRVLGSHTLTILNVIVARAWERRGDVRRAAAAASRNEFASLSFTSGALGMRERGRLLLAAGDTAEALLSLHTYFRFRAHAEPAEQRADEELRAKLAEIERKKR